MSLCPSRHFVRYPKANGNSLIPFATLGQLRVIFTCFFVHHEGTQQMCNLRYDIHVDQYIVDREIRRSVRGRKKIVDFSRAWNAELSKAKQEMITGDLRVLLSWSQVGRTMENHGNLFSCTRVYSRIETVIITTLDLFLHLKVSIGLSVHLALATESDRQIESDSLTG